MPVCPLVDGHIGAVLCCAAQSDVDVATLKAKGLPLTDAEELLPVCFRCGATNNLAGYQVKRGSEASAHTLATACAKKISTATVVRNAVHVGAG